MTAGETTAPDDSAAPRGAAPGGATLAPRPRRGTGLALLTAVLLIAAASLIYELIISTVGSYLLGDAVTQFSLTIGTYLSALGLGSYLSKYLKDPVAEAFLQVELATALAGGLSAPLLFLLHPFLLTLQPLLLLLTFVVGTLVGLELPLLIRLLHNRYELRDLVARALSVDYAGSLFGSLAFTFWLLPKLGLMQAALLCGCLNAIIAGASTWWLAPLLPRRRLWAFRLSVTAVLSLLIGLLLHADRLLTYAEEQSFGAKIEAAEQSPYQRLVLVGDGSGHRLYLNGHLQFDSHDEYRYHELLVHPALASVVHPRRVLIGGGGDGLAAREVLKWANVDEVWLVDLDPAMTRWARELPQLRALNRGSLDDPRLTVRNEDAFTFLQGAIPPFDVMIFDFPDPSSHAVGKLYTRSFYGHARRHLAPGGVMVTQATSPLLAREAFWCIGETLRSAGFTVRSYHGHVPSFGPWGFHLAAIGHEPVPRPLPALDLRYLDRQAPLLPHDNFPEDMARLPVAPSGLNDQRLVTYYVAALVDLR